MAKIEKSERFISKLAQVKTTRLESFDPELAKREVQIALEHLNKAATPEMILESGNPDYPYLAGIVGSYSVERGLNRDEGKDRLTYEDETLFYSGFDPDMDIPGAETREQDFSAYRRALCWSIIEDDEGWARALVAVGPEGALQLGRGHAPFHAIVEGLPATCQYRTFAGKDFDANLWDIYFERHHRGRKSGKKVMIKNAEGLYVFPEVDGDGKITNLRPEDRLIEMPTNTIENLVIICGGPSAETDFHSFYHAALQLAQEGVGYRKVLDGIHAAGLFYPCVSNALLKQRGGFRTVKELRTFLSRAGEKYGPENFDRRLKNRGFYDTGGGAEQIVAACKAMRNEPFVLGPEEQKMGRVYRHIYEVGEFTKDEQENLAEMNDGVVEKDKLTREQTRWLQNSRRAEAKKVCMAYAQEHFLGAHPVHRIPMASENWQIMQATRWQGHEKNSHLHKIIQQEFDTWQEMKPHVAAFRASDAYTPRVRRPFYLNNEPVK